MKIYDEVTIDMNPESSTYGEHLSEDSSNYNGDVALCGGADPTKIQGGYDPRPGVMAMGRGGGKVPGSLDPVVGGDISGITDVGGKTIEGIDPIISEGVDRGRYSGTRQGRFLGTGRRRTYDTAQEEAFSDKFREGWYDPYLDTALKNPMQQIREKGFEAATTENTGLSQDVINQYLPAGMGDLQGERVIEKGSLTQLGDIKADMELAKQEAEFAKEGALEDIDIAEEEATLKRDRALQEGAQKRAQLAQGTLTAEQAARAPLGTTGFAYSGPQQRALQTERGQGMSAMETMARNQQQIESDYQKAREGFETGREDVETQYGKAIDTAELDYERGAAGALDTSKDAVNELLRGAEGLVGSHMKFGQDLVAGSADPGWGGFSEARNIYGQTGYGAPTQGWFRDAPGFSPTKDYLNVHEQAYENLRRLTGGEMLGTAPTEGGDI